jgi:hypothetical protein
MRGTVRAAKAKGYAMFGNFDSPMELLDKGETLVACGPLQWEAPDEESVTVEVTITQKGQPVVGNSGQTSFSPANNEWMFPVPAQKELKPGLADATGRAFRVGSGVEAREWNQVVRLTRKDLGEEEVVEIVQEVIASQTSG